MSFSALQVMYFIGYIHESNQSNHEYNFQTLAQCA